MVMNDTRTALLSLLRDRALLHGEFILSSGQPSAYYLDARLVTLSAVGAPLVARAFLDALPLGQIDAVAGLTVGADPIVTSIAVLSGFEGRSIDALIVRKETKQHGTVRRIEGPWHKDRRVAIVDDTLTTGASSLQAAQTIVESGGTVCGVYALIDRGQGAGEAIQAAGYSFTSIFTAAEILQENGKSDGGSTQTS